MALLRREVDDGADRGSARISERSAREIIKGGVGFIDGYLHGMSETA